MLTSRARVRAFTLTELLVVIVIIVILLALLLSSLGAARATARTVVCSTKLRSLVEAQFVYADTYRGYIASANTSGLLSAWSSGTEYIGDTSATTPTTTHDWISPTLGDSLGLSSNRARRTRQIFEEMRCPNAVDMNVELWGFAADNADFEAILESEGFPQVSYLAPSGFHYVSNQLSFQERRVPIDGATADAMLKMQHPMSAARIPRAYRPHLDRIGTQPANKIAVADGTRYWNGSVLDFDIDPTPLWYSSFVSSGPTFQSSTAYGRGTRGDDNRQRSLDTSRVNVQLSFREPGLSMNVAQFDGHVVRMQAEDAWADPTPWFPTGSKWFGGGQITPECEDMFEEDEPLP